MAHQMEHPGHGNVFGTIASVIFLFIAKFTLSDLAAVAAALAGFTTAWVNVHRYLKERKAKKDGNTKP